MWPRDGERCVQPESATRWTLQEGRHSERARVMDNVLPIDGDAYRAAMAWTVLRRIRRRQDELRRRWYELTREQVEAELLTIGRELAEAAPLFLPRSFDSGGHPASCDNGKGFAHNGHYRDAGEDARGHPLKDPAYFPEPQRRTGKAPEARSQQDETLRALVSDGERLLDALQRLLREMGDGDPEAEASS